MGIALATFISGIPLYRFQRPRGNPLTRICQVVVASWRKFKLELPQDSCLLYETSEKQSVIKGSRKLEHTDIFKCLDKAAVLSDEEMTTGHFSDRWRLCTVTQVEELKILISMFPIWVTIIMYSAVYAQMATMFVEQGNVMDRTVGPFTIPAASLSVSHVITGIIWIPVYDKLLVPMAWKFTGKDRGISELQRMGIGLFFSMLSMVAAALVEIRRLQLVHKMDLVDENVNAPLNISWQIPQYALVGTSEIFLYVGKVEFFYNQSPDAMRSLCSALPLLTISVGNYLSSAVLTILTAVTTAGGKPGWVPDNLNKGHLDYYFFSGLHSVFEPVAVCILCH